MEFRQGVTSVKDFDKLCAYCVALCGISGYISLLVGVVFGHKKAPQLALQLKGSFTLSFNRDVAGCWKNHK